MLLRMISSVFIILFIITVSLFLLVKFLESTAVFFPGKTLSMTPAQASMAYEDLYISTVDHVKINAWFIKSHEKDPTLIFAHGNAGTMSERIMKIKFWHDMGLNVLIFDYRGYARSEGKPSEEGVYLDAQAVYDYLAARPDIDPSKIIAYGASLGGAVMTELATRRKVAALIIESSFTSASNIARIHYPLVPTIFMSIKFDTIAKINQIEAPKLFLHSPEDHTVPYQMGQALFNKAKNPKEFITIHGGHNEGSLVRDPQIRQSIQDFLRRNRL